MPPTPKNQVHPPVQPPIVTQRPEDRQGGQPPPPAPEPQHAPATPEKPATARDVSDSEKLDYYRTGMEQANARAELWAKTAQAQGRLITRIRERVRLFPKYQGPDASGEALDAVVKILIDIDKTAAELEG